MTVEHKPDTSGSSHPAEHEARIGDTPMKINEATPDSDDDLLTEKKTTVKAQTVVRKIDRFLLWKFFLLTVLCYLDR